MFVPPDRQTMAVDRPRLPDAALAGWQETEVSESRPFDARVVSVHAHTVVYDDTELHEQIADAAGVGGRWRFFVAARLALEPRTAPSGPLTRLVADRAHTGFADRLTERGLTDVRERDTTTRQIDGCEARVGRFAAVHDPGPVSVRTTARVAVRPNEDSYLLAGGAYPTAVRDGDPDTARAVASLLEPDRFDAEQRELVAAVE